jgi:electron transfer flavoprotein beta subunit
MKIAVCVKHVPDGRLRIAPESKRLDRSGPGELNKVDKNAIEEALRLKAAHDAELVVVSMGPDEARESLRTALALGADRGVLISDPAAVGSDLVATSKVLAAALQREEPDLVLFGQQTSDGGGAVLWAAVAERLRRPFASQAAELTMDRDITRVTRQTEAGDEVIEVPLPAVVAVSDSINEPRYTSLKGMMGAKKKPLEVLALADLGLDPAEAGEAGSKTTVLSLADPPGRSNSIKVKDEGNAAQVIVDFLAEKQLA